MSLYSVFLVFFEANSLQVMVSHISYCNLFLES